MIFLIKVDLSLCGMNLDSIDLFLKSLFDCSFKIVGTSWWPDFRLIEQVDPNSSESPGMLSLLVKSKRFLVDILRTTFRACKPFFLFLYTGVLSGA